MIFNAYISISIYFEKNCHIIDEKVVLPESCKVMKHLVLVRTHASNLLIIIYAGAQVESDEARRHLYFHWSANISGKPYLQRPLFQTNI
jgi:hypothetical protein